MSTKNSNTAGTKDSTATHVISDDVSNDVTTLAATYTLTSSVSNSNGSEVSSASTLTSTVSNSSGSAVSSASTLTSSVSNSNGSAVSSASTFSPDAVHGSISSSDFDILVTSSTLTKRVDFTTAPTYATTKAFTSTKYFSSSTSKFTTNPSTNDVVLNISNSTMIRNDATNTSIFKSSIRPSDVSSLMSITNMDSTIATSSKTQSSSPYLNKTSDLIIALSVSCSVLLLIICIAVISVIYKKRWRKRFHLKRTSVKIEIPDIFVRLSCELVTNKRDQQVSQSPGVMGLEEIKRISSTSVINSKIPERKPDNMGTGSHIVGDIAIIDITSHSLYSTASKRKGDNCSYAPDIAFVQLGERSGNNVEFYKKEKREDETSDTLNYLPKIKTDDETFTEIKL